MMRALLVILVFAAGCAKEASDLPDAALGAPADAEAQSDAAPEAPDDAATAAPDDAALAAPDASAAPDAQIVVTSTDPFALVPPSGVGLTDVATDLRAILENGALEGACDAWALDPNNQRKKLLCGKYMYFYESFGTAGLPLAIVQSLMENFPEMGPGFAGVGLIEDPLSSTHLPIGLSKASTATTAPPSVALTCASCHFARLDDGRYAVGAPNHDYDYGKHILSIVLLPQLARTNPDLSVHHPDAIAKVRTMLDRLQMDRALRIRFLIDLLPLLALARGGMIPMLTIEDEGHYAGWLTGTQDFTIPPVPINDGVHTISKISALFSVPRIPEWRAYQMPSAMLGWVGESPSIEDFVHGFVQLGAGPASEWTDARLEPLVDYVYSLRPPIPPTQDRAEVLRGEALFQSAGCLDCHNGPRGSGRRLYDYPEIGTDDAMRAWMDPDLDGQPCCGVQNANGGVLHHKLKSPRLMGLWSAKRFLHNGAVPSLESLLCTDGNLRGSIMLPAYGDGGHTFGCALSAADKAALISYLKSH